MKKSLSKQKIFSRIPFSKSKGNKINLDFSIKGLGRIVSKNKNDSNNKETIDGSCADTQTFAFNQDSFNYSKGTINKNYSLGRFDNKLILFTSSLKNDFDKNYKLLNFSKKFKIKSSTEFCTENISSCEDDNNIIFNNNLNNNQNSEIKENDSDEEDTNRIDYRYYPKIPEIESNKDNTYFWLATYDKLMKKSKIIKILNYYTGFSPKKSDNKIINDENIESKDIKQKYEKYNFKEKSMIIDGYEIYFLNKFNKPFIRPKKGGLIFIKLYLLNMEQINKIFSYINRLEYKTYIKNLDSIKDKNYFKIVNNSNKSIYNYSTIFCIGSFVNINIFLFSHIEKAKNKLNKQTFNISDLPSSTKIAKLIKALLMNFPDYSKEYFIDYLLKPFKNNYELNNNEKELLNQKKNEISSLLLSNNKKSLKITKKHKNSTNSVIKNVIQKIPTYTQSSNKTPDEFYNFSDISPLNDKNNLLNPKTNEINNFGFFNKMNIKQQKSEKNFKKIDMNCLLDKKLNNIKLTRNSQNNIIYNNNNNNFTHRPSKKDSKKIKFNNISNSIRQIKLINQNKKSLTRNNTDGSSIQYKDNKLKKNYKNNSDRELINRFKKLKENQENNKNILNTSRIVSNTTNNYVKTDLTQYNKNTRNKMKLNPFYLTNTNNIREKNNSKKTRNKKYNESLRVLSSIKKVISQKINNMTGNTSSLNVNNLYVNNSNSSLMGNKNYFVNNESNKNIKKSNYNKLVCKTKNNSKNQKSEYITPIKERFKYYYH